jgi:hypothetical protein
MFWITGGTTAPRPAGGLLGKILPAGLLGTAAK